MAEKIISPGVYERESDQSSVRRGPVTVGAALVGPTVKGAPLVPTVVTSYSEYANKFGEKFKSGSNYYEYFTSLAAKEYFNSGGGSLLVTPIVSGSSNLTVYATASIATTGSAGTAAFELESVAWGDIANNSGSVLTYGALSQGTADNVRWEVTNSDTSKGIFTIVVRRGDDNNNQKNILETFANVCLDPQLPNFISRVIGDKKPVYTTDSDGTAYVYESGSFANASNYVRVRTVTTLHVNSLDNNGTFLTATYSGSMPAVGSGSLHGAFIGGTVRTNLAQKMFENSSTGNSTSNNIQGYQQSDYVNAFNLLSNKNEYDFNLLLAPGVSLNSGASDDMISICESRGDVMSIIDAQEFGGTVTAAITAAASSNSNYAAAYWPWVQVYSNNLGKSVWVPPSVVLGGVYAFNDAVGAEWFAPAGFTRGGIGSVLQAERKLTKTNIDDLYSSNVNALATFPGNGVVCWGQKTLQKRQTALDRVGVRRLLISIKRFLDKVSRELVFEQNTNATRNRFLATANPYLETVVQKQGLYTFQVIMDDSNNTNDVIDRQQLVGQVRLYPTRTAEYIILDFNIQPAGTTQDS
jgi:phage tail sheath protein FI